MNKLKRLLATLAIGASLVGCQATNDVEQGDHPVVNVPFAGSLQHDFRKELEIARINQALNSPEITTEQRAALHHKRGALYDSVGLSTLARLDFNYALKLKPDFAEVYNFTGIYYTLAMQYEQAYESFDAVIELLPEHQYAYLNRGIALYYGSRPDLAERDLKKFLNADDSDSYRAVWVYLATREVDATRALTELQQHAEKLDKSRWSYQLVQYFLGELSERDLLLNVQKDLTSHREYLERLCEAYFYLAKDAVADNKPLKAEDYFNLAMATNVYEFVEYKYARLELRLLYSDEQTPDEIQ